MSDQHSIAIETLLDVELEYRKEAPRVTPGQPRLGSYIGSGVGRAEGDDIRGEVRWDLFETRNASTCDANLRGVIETEDGGRLGFDVLGFFRRPMTGSIWTLSGAVLFESEEPVHAALTRAPAVWEGEFDEKTYRHRYRVSRMRRPEVPPARAQAGQPSTDLDRIFAPLSSTLPELTETEQRIGLEVYRQLTRGEPLDPTQVATPLGMAASDVAARLSDGGLRCLVHTDGGRRILGFGGLSVVPMAHRFAIEGATRPLYTWCAWDGLFLPVILGVRARLESRDPRTGRPVELLVSPNAVEEIAPAATVVSFLLPDAALYHETAREVIGQFCRYIHFFASTESAADWTAEHPGTFILRIEDAFRLGQMHSRARFNR
ncbi:MAG: hypothetical protein L0271_01150 [Gemmatimonadetes bacterium]|nr:hypothetical protein [Gemmatimonadota bacterium]